MSERFACAIPVLAALVALVPAPATGAPGAGLGPAIVFPGAQKGATGVDYRRFRQLYPDPYASPYFYAPPAYRYAPPPPPPAYYGPPFAYGWVPPPRPSSCGQYYYWDGTRCVDARRWPPYVGPK
jgi:hypothetical protein